MIFQMPCRAKYMSIFFTILAIFVPITTTISQQSVESPLKREGALSFFVSRFNYLPCISSLSSEKFELNKSTVRYYACPRTLMLVRIQVNSSFDKSRFATLLQPLPKAGEKMEFFEIKFGDLVKTGIDPEAIYSVLFPRNSSLGMGDEVAEILDVKLRSTSEEAVRNHLLRVQKRSD